MVVRWTITPEGVEVKRCRVCGMEKPRSDYYPKDARCKTCKMAIQKARVAAQDPEIRRAYNRQWYKRDPSRQKAASLRWYAKNKESRDAYIKQWGVENPHKIADQRSRRRARKLGAEGSFTEADVDRIFKAQKGRCAYCRCKLKREEVHRDHIHSLAKGGSNHARNIQITCGPCNFAKSAKDPIDFARQKGLLI